MSIYRDSSFLSDFQLEEEFIKDNRIRKAYVNSTHQEVIFKYVQNNNFDELKNEFINLDKCTYPSIQKVFALYEPPNRSKSILITPFCSKMSLNELLSQSDKLTTTNQIIIIYGICNAMKYLEKISMFHGNLDPSNILIDKFTHPIINNIGDKLNEEQIKGDNHIMINYMAPEIINNQNYSIKADVYSFGLLINYIFTKENPYSNFNTKKKVFDEIKKSHFPPLYEEPNWIFKSIVKRCLNSNPKKRPTFDQLCDDIYKLFDKKTQKLINKYLDEIDAQISCPITFFRVPKYVFNPNQKSNSPIEYGVFHEMFSNVGIDTKIVLIMVFGMYQVGKSTFLKSMTGNGAFTIGDGKSSQTKGIIIDGPYSIQDLIDRIPENLKDELLHIDEKTVIYFIDSQGLGDKTAEQIEAIKRIHSVFCSLSTICIYVTNSKMKMNDDFYNQVIFLVKVNCQDDTNELLNEGTRDSFVDAKENLESFWEYSSLISKNLPKNSSIIIPYGNLNTPDAFNNSIWNSFIEINNIIHKNFNYIKNKEELIQLMKNDIDMLFSKKFDDIFNHFNHSDFPEDIRNSNSDFQMRIYALSQIFLTEIDEAFLKFKKDKTPDEERRKGYQNILDSFRHFASYIVRNDSQLTIVDYNQYMYDFTKCVCHYLKKKEPNFKFVVINEEVSKQAQVLGSIGAFSATATLATAATAMTVSTSLAETTVSIAIASTEIASVALPTTEIVATSVATAELTATTVLPAASSAALAVCAPICIALAGCLLIGGCAWLAYSIINENNYKKFREKCPQLSFPFLWNKIEKAYQNKVKILDVMNDGKLASKVTKDNIIVAFENTEVNNEFYPMKFIIQCLTGIQCQYKNIKNESKEALLFGPFKPQDLIVRTSIIDSNYKSNIKDSIYILYLRNCNFDINQTNIKFIFSSTKLLKPQENMIPKMKNSRISHLFCFDDDFDRYPVFKQNFEVLRNQVKQKMCITNANDKINVWPIFMSNIKRIGPTTNKTLSIAFHHILDRQKNVPIKK